ncbi:MAG TPA: hypothetical protein VG125_14910 [Pirellulales bacterium]|nr:hypothetical protein [Pirellulales bacterium]
MRKAAAGYEAAIWRERDRRYGWAHATQNFASFAGRGIPDSHDRLVSARRQQGTVRLKGDGANDSLTTLNLMHEFARIEFPDLDRLIHAAGRHVFAVRRYGDRIRRVRRIGDDVRGSPLGKRLFILTLISRQFRP